MKKLSILAVAPLLAMAGVAHAADWTLTFAASGTVWGPDAALYPLTDLTLFIKTSDELTSGPYSGSMGQGLRVLSMTGTRNGETVTLLQSNAGTPYGWAPDLMLYVNDPQLISFDGLSYETAAGTAFNLYGSTYSIDEGAPDIQWFEAAPFASSNPNTSLMLFQGTVTLTQIPAVPEPASWALALAGVAMLGGLARARRLSNYS